MSRPRITLPEGRSVLEWIGKTPDSKPPPRVRLRVFERERGICHLSGRKITPGELWDADHKIALINGGENRERNLFPALKDKHKEKTSDDVAEKAHRAKVAKKHVGITQPKGSIPQRPKQEKQAPRQPAHGMSEIARRYGLRN